MTKKLISLFFLIIPILIINLNGCSNNQGDEVKENPDYVEKVSYTDGTYTGYSDAAEHGYAAAEVTIDGGIITDVILSEVSELAVPKDYESYPWPQVLEAKNTLQEEFTAANSAEVEVIAGATYSSENFKQAVERALAAASETTDKGRQDGIYLGKSASGSRGGYAIAIVTIGNGSITNVKLKEVTGDGKFKDYETYPYQEAYEATQILAEKFIEADSDDVDVYSGATDSSILYIEAVADALNIAAVE